MGPASDADFPSRFAIEHTVLPLEATQSKTGSLDVECSFLCKTVGASDEEAGRTCGKESKAMRVCVSGYDPIPRRVGSAMAGVQSGLDRLCLALGGAQWFSGRGEGIAPELSENKRLRGS